MQLRELYQAADVLVSPYRAEGFNLPVLEAMAGGLTDDFVLPDMGIQISSTIEQVQYVDGSWAGGWLMPDRQQLVRALLQLYDRPAMRRQLATRALAHAKAHYSWD